MNPVGVGAWIGDWVWGLPLIVLTVVIHVCGLAVIGERVDSVIGRTNRRRFILKFARVMGTTALLATMLHGFEAFIWASAYRIVGALPDNRTGMLYSLSAMTTYGHANLFLQDRWQMMGALEALNGMLLFGLTTAFMFGMMQRSLAVKS
jgi:hypothetical protein